MALYVDTGYVENETQYFMDSVEIFWGESIIYVPKNYMTLVQSTPIEIRTLDLNEFRLTLKNLEDDVQGMPFQKTHTHNTTFTVGGITFARVIAILPPYTITFEDGSYLVNATGANSNVADRVNPNNVSVRSNNSAGLIEYTVNTSTLTTEEHNQLMATLTKSQFNKLS